MSRKQNSLVPIGEAFDGLGGPVQALRAAPPPLQRGFTVADQVHQLVSASEADPDRGFMARLMALCSLPRTSTTCGATFRVSVASLRAEQSCTTSLATPRSMAPCCRPNRYTKSC